MKAVVEQVAATLDELTAVLRDPFARGSHGADGVVYRGCSNAAWGLETSLSRCSKDPGKHERPLLRDFAKRGASHLDGRDLSDLWLMCAIGQHYGLPTRLLDWTTSPNVASHFACEDLDQYANDGVIWVADVVAIHDVLPKKFEAITAANPQVAMAYDDLRSVVATLDEWDGFHSADRDYVIFFEFPHNDQRWTSQEALFSVMTSPSASVIDEYDRYADALRRIIVPSALKPELRADLDRDTANEERYFPGLDGVARTLRRRVRSA